MLKSGHLFTTANGKNCKKSVKVLVSKEKIVVDNYVENVDNYM